MLDDPIVIVSAARTPIGSFKGCLSEVAAPQLGSVASKAVLDRAGIAADQVDELLFGCVLSAGLGQAPARQVALLSGLPASVACTTVNKVCGSGMKTIMQAHDQIKAGTSKTVIAGGMESMSRAPYLLPKARKGLHLGHARLMDHLFFDGLEDAETGLLMGCFAQDLADHYGLSRSLMDEYAMESLKRAKQAVHNGFFKDEIVPVTLPPKNGKESSMIVLEDEEPSKINQDKITTLKPVFKDGGSITAANSSSISDGAAALLLMSEKEAQNCKLPPLARIVAHASHARIPSEFLIAPISAIRLVMEKANWEANDVDLFEINEAFSMATLLSMDALDIDSEKLNVNGGSSALGHPIGATGARIVVTLLYALRRLNKKRGIASLCIGGGEATAIAIELI